VLAKINVEWDALYDSGRVKREARAAEHARMQRRMAHDQHDRMRAQVSSALGICMYDYHVTVPTSVQAAYTMNVKMLVPNSDLPFRKRRM
jgi:hypothetical protein